MRFFLLLAIIGGIGFQACQSSDPTTDDQPTDTRFTERKNTGIDFENTLSFKKDFNIYTYRNFYNGAGVAIGDVNNDGLVDLYFTANMEQNRLYLNKGNWTFEDVTEQAGVGGKKAWSTGVSMADVNGDGWLDIYVCNSGDIAGDNKENEFFINQQDGTFKEEAAAYNLADPGYSTHAAFFDYDRDGDLDMYLLNNSYQAIGSFNLRKNERPIRDPEGGDKLMRNDGNRFTDVSEAANIYGSIIGFGLGVTVGDVNLDGWMDIYVSNDFFERDYLYINQQNGTFSEELTKQFRSISGASMGADMADINNDGRSDIFVTEMLPEPEMRIKTSTTFENWNRYQYNLQNDYFHQFTRNMLQLNNGNSTFSEIGRLADVEATDWSWGALLFDMDNDGKRDIFVANGIYQDLTNQDFLNFIADEETKRSTITEDGVDYQKLISFIPSNAISNYAFQNQGDLDFANKAADWGLAKPSFSNGSAYGDIDNDGDLDLIVNNVNMPPFLFENQSFDNSGTTNYLRVALKGKGKNTQAIGSKVYAWSGAERWYTEAMPMRGFESTVDDRVFFGIGKAAVLDSVLVIFPDESYSLLKNVKANQELSVDWSQSIAGPRAVPFGKLAPQASTIFTATDRGIDFEHEENRYSDFDRDQLLYNMVSHEGPKMCQGDVNGDGLEDVYIGGAKGQSGVLYHQLANGKFRKITVPAFEKAKNAEDQDCLFFDADGDGDLDLYVATGGNEFSNSSLELADRLFLNNGNGQWTQQNTVLPTTGELVSSSCVDAADVDGDGDLDLAVGVRLRHKLYGVPCPVYLLINDGKGNFAQAKTEQTPGFDKVGLITDLRFADTDKDGDQDLIICGEWMPVLKATNTKGSFALAPILENGPHGWWNCLEPGDLNGDGFPDFVVGNHGLNSRFKGSAEQPIKMYVNDFDQNGTVEQLVTQYNGKKDYPLALRNDVVGQMPSLKKKFLKYEDYAGKQIGDLFAPEVLERSVVLKAEELRSVVLLSDGNGGYRQRALPKAAQYSPIYAISIADFTGDQQPDLLLGGNFFWSKPEMGRYDANYGLLLSGEKEGAFSVVPNSESGILWDGEVRDFVTIKRKNGERILVVSRNDAKVLEYVVR